MTTPREAGSASGDALRQALAEAFYQVDPFYMSPEYVEHHPVSPGRYLTWNEALSYDAEFDGVLSSITKPAFDRADALIAGPLAPILAERAALEARLAEMERERDKAILARSAEAMARGEAEGKLRASEWAGVVEGWKATAEAAQAEIGRLRAALKPFLQFYCSFDGYGFDPADLMLSHTRIGSMDGETHERVQGMIDRARAALAQEAPSDG